MIPRGARQEEAAPRRRPYRKYGQGAGTGPAPARRRGGGAWYPETTSGSPAGDAPAERGLGAEQLVDPPRLRHSAGQLEAPGMLEPAAQPIEPAERATERQLVPGDGAGAVDLSDQPRQLVDPLHRVQLGQRGVEVVPAAERR